MSMCDSGTSNSWHYGVELHAKMLWPMTLLYMAQTGPMQQPPTVLNSVKNLLIESDQQLILELQQQEEVKKEYDFIVVGAGTAGCTLTSRLTEVQNWDVLLLEAGGLEQFFTDIPSLVGGLQRTSNDWAYSTEPSNNYCRAYPNNQCYVPRGKVFGGSSVLNYMIATRGNRKDYDGWAAAGNPGWAYADVLPYFKKAENITIPELKNSPYHGTNGPLTISHTKYHTILGNTWLQAGRELKHRVGDYNGESQTSFSYFQFTMNTKGRRQSNPRAYIYPVIGKRNNLHTRVNAFVTKLIFDGNRAKGVVVEIRGKTYEIFARNEVILSAGAINTPQILMLSGIGPKEHLESFNITVVKDLPVGRNFQDHFSFGGLVFTTNLTDKNLIRDNIANNPKNLIDYVENGCGPFAIPGGNEGVFFYDSKAPYDHQGFPDIEIHYSTVSPIPEESVRGYRQDYYDAIFKPLIGKITFALQPIVMHPKSRGVVELRSNNPRVHPKLIPNYFQHPDDAALILKGIKKAIQITQTHAFKRFNSQPVHTRMPGCNYNWGTDEYWMCFMRSTTITNYHQSGTCEMGPNGVVDERLRVRGIDSLRVVDASIMPTVPAAHTNIPTNMIGERAADLIKADYNKLNY